MTKRRKLNNGQRTYQVPSLQSLALAAVRKRGSKTYSHSHSNLRSTLFGKMSDSEMGESSTSRTTGTSTSKRLASAADQVGQGLAVTVPRSVPHLYNNTYTVKLTYADNFRHDIAQNGSAGGTQFFRMNSIFDPDQTGTGHQPIMRDLWASQYDYYAVLQCDYTMRFYNAAHDGVTFTAVGTSSQRIGSVNLAFLRTTNSAEFTSLNNGIAYPMLEAKNVSPYMINPEETLELTGSLTQGDFMLDAKDADSDPTWTSVGSNPSISRHFGYIMSPCQWNGLVGVNETPYSSIIVQVVIDYTVQFTQMNQTLRNVSS